MSQIMTGARGIVKIKGVAVGFVGGVNVTIENTLSDVDVMGQLDVGDLAETGHKCNFSINTFKALVDPDLAASENPASSNVASAIGIDSSSPTAGVAPMRSQAYFDVEVEDEQTGETIFIMQQSKYEGGTGQMDARGLWQGTWNFRARRAFEVK